jgi:hypothetical protein
MIIGSSPRKDFVGRIVGNVLDKIVDNYPGILLVGRLIHPLNMTGRIIVFSPPFADKEPGFKPLFDKLITLARNLSKPVEIFCTPSCQSAIESIIHRFGKKLSFSFIQVEATDEFFKSAGNFKESDLLVFVNSRKGMISFNQKWHDNQRANTSLYESSNFITAYPSGNEITL